MNKLAVSTLAIVCIGLAGCTPRYADVPAPTRFANQDQQKLQSARHWQLIADHFADQIATSLKDKLAGRAIYVPNPGGEQPFVDSFRELLTTALLARGVPVSVSETNALIADVRYNAFKFSPNRAAKDGYVYGDATLLAAGLWAATGVIAADLAKVKSVDLAARTLAVASGTEGLLWLRNEQNAAGRFATGPVPRSELVLTVSVSDAGRMIARQSNIYYMSDEDVDLYWKRNSTGNVLKVVGDCSSGEAKCAR